MKENTNKEKLVVALYARVSTSRQEQEATIESQLDEIKRKIEEDGNILPAENIFYDEGWSGELIARPSLDLMRDAAKEGKFQALYAYDRGRLSRVFAHQEILIEELTDLDIKFISLRDMESNTPEGRMMQGIQGVFHEYERVKIAERMRRGKLYKARNGTIINGRALYGYKYTKKTDNTPVRYEIDENEAKTVRLIWKWFAEDRISIRQILKKLYDEGIPPKKRKSAFWTKGPVVRILKCETYVTGKAYYNKSEAVVAKHPSKDTKYKKIKKTSRKIRAREDWIAFDVPKIISDYSLYEKVQNILDFNQKYAYKKRRYPYLLSGLTYCDCGNRRVGDGTSEGGHFYYRCIERIKNFPYERKCKSSGVNAAILDAYVWRELKKKLTNYSLMRKNAEKWLNSLLSVSNEDEAEEQRIKGMIEAIVLEETRYAKAYGTGTMDFEQYKKLAKDAKKRKANFNKQLVNLASKNKEINVQITVDELTAELINVVKNIDFSEQFKVVRDIITKVIIGERSGVKIWAHLPITSTLTEKLGYEPQGWDSRSAKCREIHSF